MKIKRYEMNIMKLKHGVAFLKYLILISILFFNIQTFGSRSQFNVHDLENSMTVGPEFEFTSDKLKELWRNRSNYKPTPHRNAFWVGYEETEVERMVQVLRGKCKSLSCRVEKFESIKGLSYKVIFENEFWFIISPDPGVVEIQMKPLTLNELKINRDFIQNVIFESASEAGLYVDFMNSNGHFNIGFFSAFGDDLQTLRRFSDFMFDLENHPELWLGGLRDSHFTAVPMSKEPKFFIYNLHYLQMLELYLNNEIDTKEYSYAAIYDFILKLHRVHSKYDVLVNKDLDILIDEARENSSKAKQIMWRMSNNLHNRVANIEHIFPFIKNIFDKLNDSSFDPELELASEKFQNERLELRAIRAQRNIDDFILLAELFILRMKYLFNLDETNPYSGFYLGRFLKNPKPQDVIDIFYLYVADAGGDFEKFKLLLPSKLKKLTPHGFLRNIIRTPKTEKEFLRIKKYIPYLGQSQIIRKAFERLFSLPTNRNSMPWLVALAKELINYSYNHTHLNLYLSAAHFYSFSNFLVKRIETDPEFKKQLFKYRSEELKTKIKALLHTSKMLKEDLCSQFFN